ncbi:MAG: hypothetical protein RMY16_04820 [Nostoc sp. DedQUE12b]|uniref:hypothetical protein n=1 Tax=Nostoc sp. DedQUE12b TaxID=3075398 RepID=UPI002AD4C59B|nr:hypothetical protein [Nostoc sp. DedQUE12b]MDZ8084908.1 hypothetical protein [Nostoc sp. DedQUE12b]
MTFSTKRTRDRGLANAFLPDALAIAIGVTPPQPINKISNFQVNAPHSRGKALLSLYNIYSSIK